MKLSKLVAERTKDAPSDAKMKNHILLVRAGYMKQVANGIWSLSALGQKACRNIENIIRDEMDKLDGQEVKFPVVMPKELWDLSGRYTSIGSEMVRFQDRTGHPMLLGMTHEEAAVHLAKNWVKSYTQLPCMIYQIQTKFRDEARSRGGLIRVREFVMKDAYSFHTTQSDLDEYYFKVHKAYENIYHRIGLKNFISVKSDNGMFGGTMSHEFMFINDMGEDELVVCNACSYRANQEVAECVYEKTNTENELPLELVDTKEAKTIEEVGKFLGVEAQKCIKAVVYAVKGETGYVLCFVRGDKEVNETKLRKVVGKEVVPFEAKVEDGFVAGNIGPVGLNIANCTVVYDNSIKGLTNAVVGANKPNYHYKNFCVDRDLKDAQFVDISKVKDGDHCPECGGHVSIKHGVEIGNIFQLGTKYTKSMGMLVHDKDGNEINPIMGCYGIGVGRSLACVVEENSDEKGICMPMSIAPYKVHIVPLRFEDENVKSVANEIYDTLQNMGIDTLIDDRDCAPGVKFADADLIGMPLRVIVSPRGLADGNVEIKIRKTGETIITPKADCINKLLELIKA